MSRNFIPFTSAQLDEVARITDEDKVLAQSAWRTALRANPLQDVLDARPASSLSLER